MLDPAEMPFQYDTSHRIEIKSAVEQLLGQDSSYELKEATSIEPWQKNILKVFKAIQVSIEV
jgi:hypothetical protein